MKHRFSHLKRWWMKRQYLKVRLLNPKYTDHKASREALESLLHHLDDASYKFYTQQSDGGVEVTVFYNTIDEYRTEMKQLGLRMMNDQMIQTSWADQNERVVKLGRFLTSKEGFYLDVGDAVHGFKHEALVLCALMEKSDHAQFGVHEHNRRMLLKFFANLRALTIMLIDISFVLSPQGTR
jgi:hypothetical protein